MRASIHHFALALLILYPLQVLASYVGKTDPDVIETGTSQASPSGQLVPRERAQTSNPYEALIAKGDYEGVAERGKGMTKEEFIRDLCPLITTLDHYHGLRGFMKEHYLTPSFLARGSMVLVRKITVNGSVNLKHRVGVISADTLTGLFNDKKYERLIDLLTTDERNRAELRSKGGYLSTDYNTSIHEFHKKVNAVNNIQFKRFLLRYGEDLNEKYPITFKTVCKELANLLRRKIEKFKDFLGQPFPFPPSAIIEIFSPPGINIISAKFLDVAPREAFEECLTEPSMGKIGEYLWGEIVKKFPETDPTFPPSHETRERVLGRFPTKHQMEMTWTEKNVPNYKAVIATKRKVITAYISSLGIFPTVLVNLTVEYIPVTCSWLYLPAK